jgi:hypothetical protein
VYGVEYQSSSSDWKLCHNQSEFDQFEDAWEKVEDGIKAKSPKEYEAVEEMTEKVMAELNKVSAQYRPSAGTIAVA